MEDRFCSIIQQQETHLKKWEKSFGATGYAKLLLVVVTGVLVYRMVAAGYSPGLVAAGIASATVLIALWIYHGRLHSHIEFARGITAICNRQLDRINRRWTAFADVGTELADPDHPYGCDLDIVGPSSLFQLLNTTHTWHGRQTFAGDLLHPRYSREEIRQRQQAIAELSGDLEFSCRLQYEFSRIGVDSSAPALVEALADETPFSRHGGARAVLVVLPVLSFLFIGGVVGFQQRGLYLTAAIIALAQAILWVAGLPATQRYFGAIMGLPYKLSAYCSAIESLGAKSFSSEKLQQIQGELRTAARAMGELDRLADRIQVRQNGVDYALLNIFLLWDYECAFLLQEWKRRYAQLAPGWFAALGQLESLLCFSHLPNICSRTCLPQLSDKEGVIRAQGLGHPLLPNEVRVDNHLAFGGIFSLSAAPTCRGRPLFCGRWG